MKTMRLASAAAIFAIFAAIAPASAQPGCSPYVGGTCGPDNNPPVRWHHHERFAPAPRIIFRQRVVRRIIGYRPHIVRQPIFRRETIIRPVVVAPPLQPMIVTPQPVAVPCGDCAVDLNAVFVGCVIRDGQQLWQYRASDGIVYNMTVERRGPNDLIRRFPDGKVAWVARG